MNADEASSPPPELPGVVHRYVAAADGVRIHVADGRAIMLVHGFPRHRWEWHERAWVAAHHWGGLANQLRPFWRPVPLWRIWL